MKIRKMLLMGIGIILFSGCSVGSKLSNTERYSMKKIRISSKLRKIELDKTSTKEDYITTSLFLADQGKYQEAVAILSQVNRKLDSLSELEIKVRVNLCLMKVAINAGDINAFNLSRHYLDSVEPNSINLVDVEKQIMAVKHFNNQYGR